MMKPNNYSAARTHIISLVLIATVLACRSASVPLETPPATLIAGIIFDCTLENSNCALLEIQGDAPDAYANGQLSFFHGFADPTIRRDPQTGRLWLAYSWPRVHEVAARQFVPGVDIRLAYSDDGGASWHYDGELWTGYEDRNRGQDGAPGFTDHEVANLLPRQTENGVVWYGARLDYFIPLEGKYAARPPNSFRIAIMQAASPPDLRFAPTAVLGAALTSPAWGVDVNLAALSLETRKCNMWNEPALYFENEELFLILRCLAFDVGKNPDPSESDIFVYATKPEGDVKSWQWRYVGKLAGHTEAVELGGQGLTQTDIALAQDGALLAIFTPDDWDTAAGEFIHYGCRVVEVESLNPPELLRDEDGKLAIRAVISASDQMPLGPGSCAYDPASATGLLIARRQKTATEMNSYIFQTGILP